MAKPFATKRPGNARIPKTESPVRATELDLIRSIRRRTGRSAGSLRLGIGDDCAILRPKAGEEIVVTTDFSLEGVHFRRDWHTPESVGHRCLARGLSDLAAMGARPLAAFLSMSLPAKLARTDSKAWLTRFFDGLMALAQEHGVPLAGGDTAQSSEVDGAGSSHTPSLAFDIVLMGAVKQGHAFLRSAARAGDVIYVTGNLGGSAAELLHLARRPRAFSALRLADTAHPHLYPAPRVPVGLKLASSKLRIHAVMDLSDGLSTDLTHLGEASGLGAELDESALPIHALAKNAAAKGWAPSALHLALNGGEDYELLFTAPKWTPVPQSIAGVAIHPIGQMTRHRSGSSRCMLHRTDGRTMPIDAQGWQHFRSSYS